MSFRPPRIRACTDQGLLSHSLVLNVGVTTITERVPTATPGDDRGEEANLFFLYLKTTPTLHCPLVPVYLRRKLAVDLAAVHSAGPLTDGLGVCCGGNRTSRGDAMCGVCAYVCSKFLKRHSTVYRT